MALYTLTGIGPLISLPRENSAFAKDTKSEVFVY